jgi:hypothetical protein
LGFAREQRGIENGLHGVRDGTLREDAGRVREGSAVGVMAAHVNIIIFLFHRLGHRSPPAAWPQKPRDCNATLRVPSGGVPKGLVFPILKRKRPLSSASPELDGIVTMVNAALPWTIV